MLAREHSWGHVRHREGAAAGPWRWLRYRHALAIRLALYTLAILLALYALAILLALEVGVAVERRIRAWRRLRLGAEAAGRGEGPGG